MSIDIQPVVHDAEAEQVFFGFLANPPEVEPFDAYRWLHAHAPIFRTGNGMVVLSRYADIDHVLRNRAFGRGKESVLDLTDLPPRLVDPVMARWKRTMVFANPPKHTRLRKKVAAEVGPQHVFKMRESILATARRLLAELAEDPGGDFVQMVAYPLGGASVGDLLGVPEADRPMLARLSPESVKIFDPLTATQDLHKAAEAEIEMADYFASQLAERRADPRGDLMTRLVYPSDGDPLEEIEMVAALANIMNAGNDSAANLLSNAFYALLTNTDQFRLLRERPELLGRAVEELARYDPPLNLNPRTALESATVAGFLVEEGQIVVNIQGAGSRDPARFTDPDRLDITRDEGGPLAFGGGAHYCLGQRLGRLEIEEFLRALIEYDRIELAGPAERRPGHNLRGFNRLPVVLHR